MSVCAAQVVVHLPRSKCEALSSNLSITTTATSMKQASHGHFKPRDTLQSCLPNQT
jgi:hypothetical protein